MLCKNADALLLSFPWGRIEWLVSGELGNSDSMTLGRVTILPGAANPRHRHPNCDEVLHLLAGRLEHSVGPEQLVLEPGDSVSIPANAYHNARCISAEPAHMIIAFSAPDRQTEAESGSDDIP